MGRKRRGSKNEPAISSDVVRRVAQELGRRGGQARAKNLTREQLQAIGKKGGRPKKKREQAVSDHSAESGPTKNSV